MKRRSFVRALTAGSAATPAVLAQRPQRTAATSEPAAVATVPADTVAAPVARFFSPLQLGTLRRLSVLVMPPLDGAPGALEAGAPEFLDFLLSVSPAERKQRYRAGLDHLDAQARKLHRKPFADLGDTQAAAVLKPLLAPWTFEPPADPLQRFLTEARADIRLATINSREWSQQAQASRRGRRGGGATGYYWRPIDPTRPA